MKNRKRIISLLCAVVMIFAMAVPALAAEDSEDSVEFVGLVSFDQVQAANPQRATPETFLMPYNGGSGETGTSICFIKATTTTLSLAVRLKPGTGSSGTTYTAQLWKINPNGSETKVGDYQTCNFGYGPSWSGLTKGTQYYVKVSSTTVPQTGAECEYVYSTSGVASFN